jgi:protein involved in polysaccharide export with SLBB domain
VEKRTRAWSSRAVQLALAVCAALLAGLEGGCAALTNPTADGIPVRRVPRELLTDSHHDEMTVPLNLLGQCAPDTYRVEAGDVLGIYVEGFLGDRTLPIPTHVGVGTQFQNLQRPLPPSIGYPVRVEGDGKIDLPGVGSLKVTGMTLAEIREAIRRLYVEKKLLKEGNERVLVSLLQPRYSSILVLRQEATTFAYNQDERVPNSKRGLGFQIDLPAYENDVLHALTRSGGLPGLDACNEVVVLRSCFRTPTERAALLGSIGKVRADQSPLPMMPGGGEVVRIPLRGPKGCVPMVRPEDVLLRTGDVVFLEARDNPYFYTAGLLPPGRHVLPRDRDIDVLEAIALIRGPMFNGAFGGSNLSGDLLRQGIGNPSPRQVTVVRRTPGGGQIPIIVDLDIAVKDPTERIPIRNGDLLILQEAPGDAMARYFTQTFFNFNVAWEAIHSRFISGVVDVSAPDRLPGRLSQTTFLPQ